MPDRSVSSLGEIIRQQRELAELSMRQFAELAGISNPYLSQIERGLRAPSEHVLDAIARTLKVSADGLYRQAGMAPPGSEPAANAVLDAIAADDRLTARQRTALREVYEAFVSASPRQGRRRATTDGGAGAADGSGAAATGRAAAAADGGAAPATAADGASGG